MLGRCVDCNTLLSKVTYKRCHSCETKRRHLTKELDCSGINSHFYKDGRTKIIKYCLDCNKKLVDYKAKRCIRCAKIYSIASGKTIIKRGVLHPSYKHGKTHNNKCIDCSVPIAYNSTRCRKCATKIKHKLGILNIKGKNNPHWKDGTGNYPYPSEFNKSLKYQIFSRDKFTCQECFMYPVKNLSVHHIDYNRDNNKENNLITLCIKCNIRANKNRNFYTAKYQQLLINI